MSTKDKIQEAQFFLKLAREYKGNINEFVYLISACIISARSIPLVLQAEGRNWNRDKFDIWWEKRKGTVDYSNLDFELIREIRNTHLKEGNRAVVPISQIEFTSLPVHLRPKGEFLVDPSIRGPEAIKSVEVKEIPNGLSDYLGIEKIRYDEKDNVSAGVFVLLMLGELLNLKENTVKHIGFSLGEPKNIFSNKQLVEALEVYLSIHVQIYDDFTNIKS
jgi:hypothetical protein